MRRRLLTLVTGLAVAGCARPEPGPETEVARAMATVRRFVGRDLRDADAADLKPLWDALRLLDPDSERTEDVPPMFLPVPDRVWAFGPGEYLVVESGRCIDHPGSTPVRLTVLAESGMVPSRAAFDTGWRRYLADAGVEQHPGFDRPVVVLAVAGLGTDVGRQYYAVIGDRFDLVRVARPDGTASRNDYAYRGNAPGQPSPPHGEDEWEADLGSGDRARVLRALVWLGGRHAVTDPVRARDPDGEDPAKAALSRRVRARPGVVTRLTELAAGPNAWEAEAARLALNPDDPR